MSSEKKDNIPPLKRLLFIDDDEVMLALFYTAFENAAYDYVVKTTSKAEEFLSLKESFEPDLLLLDLKMPELDGPGIIARLEDAGNTVPIIFVTGKSQVKMEEEYKKIHVIGVVNKPFDVQELPQTIENIWSGHHKNNEN